VSLEEIVATLESKTTKTIPTTAIPKVSTPRSSLRQLFAQQNKMESSTLSNSPNKQFVPMWVGIGIFNKFSKKGKYFSLFDQVIPTSIPIPMFSEMIPTPICKKWRDNVQKLLYQRQKDLPDIRSCQYQNIFDFCTEFCGYKTILSSPWHPHFHVLHRYT